MVMVSCSAHWDGLPDGQSRATVIDFPARGLPCDHDPDDAGRPVSRAGCEVVVAVRPLADYALAAGLTAGALR